MIPIERDLAATEQTKARVSGFMEKAEEERTKWNDQGLRIDLLDHPQCFQRLHSFLSRSIDGQISFFGFDVTLFS